MKKEKRFFKGLVSSILCLSMISPLNAFAANSFTDVQDGQWYSDGIDYVNENGIMTGFNETTFGLDYPIDRSQAVTILYRMAGSPDVSIKTGFTDVLDNQYYTKAIGWAYGNGITTGYNDSLFGVNDSLTREQLAMFLYRFANLQQKDTSARADLSVFPDAAELSGEKRDALSWAVANGYISGDAGRLNPRGTCTRAMTAVIIYRFLDPAEAGTSSGSQGSSGDGSSQTQKPSNPVVEENEPVIMNARTAKELATIWSDLKAKTTGATNRVIIRASKTISDFSPFEPEIIVNGPERFYILQFGSSSEASQAAAYFNARSDVNMAFVESSQTNYDHLSWGPDAINSDVYNKSLDPNGEPVVVAIIDTGANLNHPLLQNRLLPGFDFASMDTNPSDTDGHGSHVAGIIADITQGLNIYLLPIQIFSADNPYSSDYEVSLGIDYALEQGADIINLSIGIKGHSNYVETAVDKALDAGVAVVAAAGNDNKDVDTYCPAHMDEIITVGAVDQDNQLGWYSNYGDQIDVVAPGSSINSTYTNQGYHELTGTSMACPFVTGAAAMLLYENPDLTPTQLEALIRRLTTDLGATGWDPYYGSGLIDLSKY